MNCAMCGAVIDIDPADDMQPPDGKSYCGKCASLVRPGVYAVPGNVCHKALELLWSFKELPPHVRDRLALCFGPQTWNDIRKETESSYLLCNEEWLADPANRPPGFDWPICWSLVLRGLRSRSRRPVR